MCLTIYFKYFGEQKMFYHFAETWRTKCTYNRFFFSNFMISYMFKNYFKLEIFRILIQIPNT